MALEEYRRKRSFDRTPEPRGLRGKSRKRGLRYVVQKHDATRLHYDFRLEHDGALKSWAVPKGPSLDPADKRLAVEVEDHPLDYGSFEGVIPRGQYGGGSVLLWDRGTWEPKGDAGEALERGKLEFTLHGDKLRGRWLLVRTGRDGSKPQWLLRKLADDEARPASAGLVTEERPESVESGRTIDEIGQRPKRVWRSKKAKAPAVDPSSLAKARRGPLPSFVPPQLATLVADVPRDAGWLFEIKLDGYRALCRLEDGAARFLTRHENDWTDTFGHLASAAAFLPARAALLDGEVVWLGEDGRAEFQELQKALGDGRSERLVYYAFDLLHVDGWDLRATPLEERKRALHALLAAAPGETASIRFTDHVAEDGERFFRAACGHGLEGIVAKRAGAAYREGRGRDWLKIKCLATQELVISGYTEPSGSRQGLGALLVAVHDDGKLRHAGKVGTGFDTRTLRDLLRRLQPLERATPPVVDPPRGYKARGVHWVEPKLVAQVAFTGWTDEGIVRHPSFQGLREDKEASEVVRERPAASKSTATEKRAPRKPREPGKRRGDGSVEVAGVRISNPDRVLYPEQGITKLELVRHYERVADLMLPYLDGRPLTLVRCPSGRGQCFYQKHLGETVPSSLVEVPVTERSGERTTYVCVESLAGLLTLPQMGVLELHPWGARRQHLERPDVLIFDLDPGPGVDWKAVVAAARELRALLAELELESFAKLTGGKGIHVVVPVAPKLEWDPVKAFCKAVVQLLAGRDPKRFVTVMAKAKRPGRIFLDYLRNGFGNTAVAPYSTRARAGAPVAVPVRWEELGPRLTPDRFTVRTLPRRLASLSQDPWEGFFSRRQRLPREVLRQLGGE